MNRIKAIVKSIFETKTPGQRFLERAVSLADLEARQRELELGRAQRLNRLF